LKITVNCPKEFLFSDLEKLYYIVLEKRNGGRNLRKRIVSFGIIEKINNFSPKKSRRFAKLFRLLNI
jgi:hypothetical protein